MLLWLEKSSSFSFPNIFQLMQVKPMLFSSGSSNEQFIFVLHVLQNSCQISVLTSSYRLKRPYSFHLSSYVLFSNLFSLLINHGQPKVSFFRYGAQNMIVSADTSSTQQHVSSPYTCKVPLPMCLRIRLCPSFLYHIVNWYKLCDWL